MGHANDNPASSDELDAILAEYMQAAEAGNIPDAQEFIARYPKFAASLNEFFSDKQRFDQIIAQHRPASPRLSHAAKDDTQGKNAAAGLDTPTLIGGTSMAPEPGVRIRYFGDYELLTEIARGGMGVVYKARQSTLQRVVALKMILVGQLANDDEVKRFYAEAQAAAKLEHPQIVPIFEIGAHEQQHYFTMAFVDGESLAHRVSREVLRPREAATIVMKVARAIAYAHVEGVVHRDLKPANILMDQAGEPHVTDFGLAKRVSGCDPSDPTPQLTVAGQVLGTPSYMPPEQAAGKSAQIGPLADVYSLGAMLYCLLTGRPPFQAASPLETLLQVLEQEPVSPRLLNSVLPRDLETICLKCLEKDPERRYDGAAALADDLGCYLSGEPIVARPLTYLERAVRLARKHRRSLLRTAATVATSLVAVVAILTGWQVYYDLQLGRLNLKTEGYPITAEVFDARDLSVIPPFTVPTELPVPLPAGEYRIQFTAPGELSQTQLLTVDRGWEPEFLVDLRDRQLWKPISIEPTDLVDVVRLADRDDVILLTRQFGRMMLRRLDGGTARAIWEQTLAFDRPPMENSTPDDKLAWMQFLSAFEYDCNVADPPQLVKPMCKVSWDAMQQLNPHSDTVSPPDLNGDGTRDLVWLLRDATSLLAVSGADGKVLWWFRTDWGSNRSVLGQPMIFDVDADGHPDLIVAFRNSGNVWIEAIRGADGTSLWKSDVGRNADQFAAICPIQQGGKTYVGVDLAAQLLLLEAAGGRPWGSPIEWQTIINDNPQRAEAKFLALSAMQLVDLNADSSTDALLFHDSQNDAVLTAVDLQARKVLWSQNLSRRIELTTDPAHLNHFQTAAQLSNWPLGCRPGLR